MKITFIEPNLKENKKYRGEISEYKVDKKQGACRVYVTLDREPNLTFMKRYEYDLLAGSEFCMFCWEMDIFEEEGSADLEYLKGTRIIAKMKKGNNGRFYVQEIKLDEEYYQEQEGQNEEQA